jgi:hypothetical protein
VQFQSRRQYNVNTAETMQRRVSWLMLAEGHLTRVRFSGDVAQDHAVAGSGKLNDRRHTARMESLRTSESNETKYNRRQRLPHVVATNRAFLGVSNAYRSIESPSGRNLFRRQQPAS